MCFVVQSPRESRQSDVHHGGAAETGAAVSLRQSPGPIIQTYWSVTASHSWSVCDTRSLSVLQLITCLILHLSDSLVSSSTPDPQPPCSVHTLSCWLTMEQIIIIVKYWNRLKWRSVSVRNQHELNFKSRFWLISSSRFCAHCCWPPLRSRVFVQRLLALIRRVNECPEGGTVFCWRHCVCVSAQRSYRRRAAARSHVSHHRRPVSDQPAPPLFAAVELCSYVSSSWRCV